MNKILIALLAAASAGPAFASVVHWNIQSATFSDGATLTGSLDFDPDDEGDQVFSVSIQGGSALSDIAFVNGAGTIAASQPGFHTFTFSGADPFAGQLTLKFDAPSS